MKLLTEMEDLKRLLCCSISIFFLRSLIAFRAHRWVTHDAASFLSYYRDLFRLSSFEDLSVQPELFAGAPTFQTAGTYPLMEWCGKLGLTPIDAFSVQSFTLQCLIAFFGLKLASGLLERYEAPPMSRYTELLGSCMLGFAPFLALRLPIGHWNLVYGLLPFQSLWSLWVQGRNSRIHGLLVSLAVYLGLSGQGGQSWLTTLLWGGTWILLETYCAKRCSHKTQYVRTALYGFLGVSLVLPRLLPMLHFAIGPESIRSFGSLSDQTIYSYLTPTVLDVLRSVFMDASVIPPTLAAGFHHEAHMPIGFGLLSFFLLPFLPKVGHRLTVFLIGFGVSLLLLTCLMCNIHPLSDYMLQFPALRWFRVPLRMLMPLALITPSILLFTATAFGIRYQVWHLLGALVAPLGPLPHFLACSLLTLKRKTWPALLLGLSLTSLYQFYLKMPEGFSRFHLEEEPRQLGEEIIREKPSLALALNRVHLDFQIGPFHINSGHAMGLSTAVGYGFPTRRYFAFIETLFHMSIPPQTTVLSIPFETHPQSKPLHVLQQLFNVQFHIQRTTENRLQYHPYPESAPAWIPIHAFKETSLKAIQTALKAAPESIKENLWSDSPHVPSPTCKDAAIQSIRFPHGTSRFEIQLYSPGHCPLILSTLYLDAWRVETSDNKELETFPAYELLLGAWVPKGNHTLTGSAAPKKQLLLDLCPLLPLLLLVYFETRKARLDASC